MEGLNRIVFILEGNRDEDFVEYIVKPILLGSSKYRDVLTYKFPKMPKNNNVKYIETVKTMNDDVLCLTDINNSRYISRKKQRVQEEHIGNVGDENIIIVIKTYIYIP